MVDDIPIDINEFNKAVEEAAKHQEKMVEKPVSYDSSSYRRIVEKVFQNVNMAPHMKNRMLDAMTEMMKASKVLEHVPPDEFERILTGFVGNEDKGKGSYSPNSVTPLSDFSTFVSPFEGTPFQGGPYDDNGKSGMTPMDIMNNCFSPHDSKKGSMMGIPGLGGLLGPQNAGNIADILSNIGDIIGHKTEGNKAKFTGNIDGAMISIEITDNFTCGLVQQVIERLSAKFNEEKTKAEFEQHKGNVDKSTN